MVQNIPNNIQTSTKVYMEAEHFCFWLQGLFELCPDLKILNEAQIKMIRDHLGYVFNGKDAQPSPLFQTVTVSSGQPASTTVTYPPYVPGITSIGGVVGTGLGSDGLPLTTIC